MTRAARGGPPAWPSALLVAAWLAGSGVLAAQAFALWRGTGSPVLAVALAITLLAGCVGLYYLLGFAAKSAWYLVAREEPARPAEITGPAPAVAVLYLTAGDFDAVAVDSLLRLESSGPKLFVLHDDGDDPEARRRMQEYLEQHPDRAGWELAVWHRPRRAGGKAGAVNWVVSRLSARWELLLLCDSDSIAFERDALARAAGEFADPGVAVVQFRNVGYRSDDDPPFQRRIARAIDVFDVFASAQAAWGYLPFFGHNALLRLADLRELGGLTPGFFSDDLDYSVRLTLAGRRIAYRSDITFAERHPADWSGFRKRARKWAIGCMQVVRARGMAVLTARRLPLAHRLGLLEFMGFYPAQALLVAGLFTMHLVHPWLAPLPEPGPAFVVSGALVVLAILAPTLAWSLRRDRLAGWPLLLWSCALVYGGSILSTAAGVLDGLSIRERAWVPTNLVERRRAVPAQGWVEALLGFLLVAVPWLAASPSLDFPATYLFVATLLFSPLTFAAYRESAAREEQVRREPAAPELRRIAGMVGIVAAAAAALMWPLAAPSAASGMPAGPAPRVRVAGDRLMVDGRPFQVRGVHYSPWPPGTGPDGHTPYPARSLVERDLDAIRALDANAVLVHDAPGWVVDCARARGLAIIYAFDLAWNDTSQAAFDRQADNVLAAIDSLRHHAGILAWILGHEVPAWVVDSLGAETIERRLDGLAARARARDPSHLLGHGNWPPTKQLDLRNFDLVCFNLYPAWPYEVSVKGFGPYLRDVLVPLARGRPLLITEFGINSLEAGESRQAQVLADCWREIAGSRTAGGVVFEWCDEWWKNFDNPVRGRGYWMRVYAPDDARRHDEDPEEYYGITGADRTPKPALAAVRRAWRSGHPARTFWPWAVLGALGLATWFAFGLGRRDPRAGPLAAGPVASRAIVLVALGLLAIAGDAKAFSWSLDYPVTGVHADDQFGWGLCGAGDQDGDGGDDIAIGARFAWVGIDTAAGNVDVYLGRRPAGWPPMIRLEGLSDNEHFGESLTGGRDVNGDGRPELAVGAPLRSTGGKSSNGAVDVFLGGALAAGRWTTLTGEASDDWFGQSVALGDLDGDGKAEIVVGAPYNDRVASAAGAVFIYRGGTSPPSAPWLVLTGEAANDQFGWSVACPGDVDGDGYGDVVVGARLYGAGLLAARGKAYLFHGGPAMDAVSDGAWLGEARDDWFGNSVAGPGDVDGGGRADVLVGAPYNDRGGSAAGAAYLFRGEDPPGSPPAAIYVGETPNAQFGWSVAGSGDGDGNGHPDVLVGARLQPSGALSAAGRIYLFEGGAPLSTTPIATVDGEAADDWFGNSVDGAGRFFAGDLRASLAGAPYNDAAASAAGRAYALGGASVTGVGAGALRPGAVLSAGPSPATGSMTLRCTIPVAGFEVLDLRGRLVRALPAASSAAVATAIWDARDDGGRAVAPGVYFVRAIASTNDSSTEVIRVSVLR